MTVEVADFGEINGIRIFRVHGSKHDLEEIVRACYEEGADFVVSPVIEHVRKGSWTTLLEIKISLEVEDVV